MITIAEDHVAYDPDTLAYPNISSCMSVSVNVRGGPMIGTHLTIGHSGTEIDGAFSKMLELTEGRDVKEIVLAGATAEWAQPKQGLGDAYRLPGLRDTLFGKFKTQRIASINTRTNNSKDNHTLVSKNSKDIITVQVWTRSGNEAPSALAKNAGDMAKRVWKVNRDGSLRNAQFIPTLSTAGLGAGRVQDKTYDLKF